MSYQTETGPGERCLVQYSEGFKLTSQTDNSSIDSLHDLHQADAVCIETRGA